MQRKNKPTFEQLKELYKKALEFREAKPWQWLYDADLICVEDPVGKTIGYCSIMGRGGEHFALGVYLGHKGLGGFSYLLANGGYLPYHQALHFQDCIMCSFEDKEELSNEDLEQIKGLGLNFSGQNAWPKFRRYEPGFAPWFLTKSECAFLTLALEQALYVVEKVNAGELEMNMELGKSILRYSEETEDGLQWFSQNLALDYFIEAPPVLLVDDEVLLQNIKKAKQTQQVIQIDVGYLPFPVQADKKTRPYFPRILIMSDKESGKVIDYHVYRDIKEDEGIILERLTAYILKEGLPALLEVRDDTMEAKLLDLCQKTDITLQKVGPLQAVDEVLEGMGQQFLG